MLKLQVNGQATSFDGPPETPLLWVLRDHMHLRGTKFGCGIGQCGACSVHIDGQVRRSCIVTAEEAAGRSVTTIEGLAAADGTLHPVQQAWLDEDVPQCGYCQAGQIMAAVDLLNRNPAPDADAVEANMTNICRCGTYVRIRKAVDRAARLMAGASS